MPEIVSTWFGHAWNDGVLLLALLLLAALFVLLPRPRRRHVRGPLLLLLVHLAAAGLRVLAADVAAVQKPIAILSVFALWAAVGQAAFVLVVEGLVGRRSGATVPRIFRDIAQLVVWFLVGLTTLRAAGVEPGSLLATSALLTAVIGLSLQDTLGNVFAGLSIQAQRPFEVGDWIQLDASKEPLGQVAEINWRATRLVTRDRSEIIVPNGVVARAQIRNLSKPVPLLRRSVLVQAPYANSPAHVRGVLLGCIADTPGTLAAPEPSVLVHDFAADGVVYRVRFFLDDAGEADTIDAAVRERIWYGMRRAGIGIPFPQRDVHLHEVPAQGADETRAARLARRLRHLRRVDLFEALSDADIRELAELVHSRRYAPGETILRQGDPGDELFVIEYGEAAILRHGDEGESLEIARLRQGDFFGEMSLMTGARRTATVRAVLECALLVVDKPSFQKILQRSPDIAERISATLGNRQEQLAHLPAEDAGLRSRRQAASHSSAILDKIREFFSL